VAIKRHKPEEIDSKPRRVEVLMGQGKDATFSLGLLHYSKPCLRSHLRSAPLLSNGIASPLSHSRQVQNTAADQRQQPAARSDLQISADFRREPTEAT
jgi:hypothetical protein